MMKVKYLFDVFPGATPDSKIAEYWDGDIIWITPADFKTDEKYVFCGNRNITKAGYDSANTTIVPANSIIVSKRAPIGTVCIASVPLCTNQGCLSCVPHKDRINSTFAYYAFVAVNEKMQILGSGTTFKEISANAFCNMKIPYFSLSRQHAIVDYLDSKCAAIDEAIERHQKAIEKLKEYKKSATTNAVTKGIHNSKEVNSSGLPEIGSTPFPVLRMKLLLANEENNIKVGPFGSSLPSSKFIDEGYWVYNQRTVLDENYETNNVCIDENLFQQLEGFRVFPHDILITTRGTIGKCSIVPNAAPEGILHPCIIRFRVNESIILPRFLKYYINETSIMLDQIKRISGSTTIEALYSYNLKNMSVVVPSVEEQKEILEYLDALHSNTNEAISRNKNAITKLQEYRKSLIYHAVTGKIDCREAM